MGGVLFDCKGVGDAVPWTLGSVSVSHGTGASPSPLPCWASLLVRLVSRAACGCMWASIGMPEALQGGQVEPNFGAQSAIIVGGSGDDFPCTSAESETVLRINYPPTPVGVSRRVR